MAEEKRGKTIKVHSKSIYDAAQEMGKELTPNKKAPKGKIFQEAAGGGVPINNDGSPEGYWGSKWGRGAMDTIQEKEKAKSERDSNQQPRTDDGKFTYNSANGKGLSKKSDPTRNFTVNPLLVGGMNGVKQEDLEEQLRAGKGELWDRFSKVTLVEKGDYTYQGKVYSIEARTLADEMKSMLNIQKPINREHGIYDRFATTTEKRDEETGEVTKETKLSKENTGKTWKRKEGGVGGQISDKETGKGWDVEVDAKVKQGRHSKEAQKALNERKGVDRNIFELLGDKAEKLFKNRKNPEFRTTKHQWKASDVMDDIKPETPPQDNGGWENSKEEDWD